jgi:hypothetical protein
MCKCTEVFQARTYFAVRQLFWESIANTFHTAAPVNPYYPISTAQELIDPVLGETVQTALLLPDILIHSLEYRFRVFDTIKSKW